jgi:DNA-binding transcriptional ArsR family regulator
LTLTIATRPRHAAVAELLKLAGDPTRLRVILALMDGEQPFGLLAEEIGGQMSQSAFSQHIAMLRRCDIIRVRREGKQNFYGLSGAGQELATAANALMRS